MQHPEFRSVVYLPLTVFNRNTRINGLPPFRPVEGSQAGLGKQFERYCRNQIRQFPSRMLPPRMVRPDTSYYAHVAPDLSRSDLVVTTSRNRLGVNFECKVSQRIRRWAGRGYSDSGYVMIHTSEMQLDDCEAVFIALYRNEGRDPEDDNWEIYRISREFLRLYVNDAYQRDTARMLQRSEFWYFF